ncbi:helix-turn-helix domain-containing protein [Tumebacillus permanentifrigoris]|uniref:Soluble NSF attachment protein (SNAP)-like n=1 Tax=Tumebacillus permanentifrigoris TaxID=378543 RepID=A0A316DAG4_9BACL|nr:helix-turn-helix domain-containing protein [Tumebacillus permanentifrigoris]PWK14259.1 soluble NSF attachment protein (SNAP)-like [Tumebacillus permanentifrigoris]
METFGQRLRQLRMKKGLNQMQLAKGIITPSMVSQIESDKAKPSYHVLGKIAEKLEIPLDELIGNLEMNLVIISEYRLAKGMLSAGEFSGALPFLKKVIQTNNGKLDPFEIRYDYAFCLLQLNQLREAEETFQQLLEHAQSKSGSLILVVRVYHQLGQVELKRRCFQIAEHYLKKAITQLQSSNLKDVHLQCSLLLAMAEIQQKSGQLKQAVVTLQLALPIFEEREDIQGLGNLYMKLAQSFHVADQYEQATDYAQRAQWCFEALNNKSEKLTLEVRLAVLQGEMGNRDKAISALESIVEDYRRLRRDEEAGITVTELAKLYLAGGKLDQAEEACQTARKLLPTVHSNQAWVARIQAGISQARNQQTVAVKYMKQAADCFKLTECHTEYEETMQELSRLYESHNDCQSALRVMHEMWSFNRQAREQRGIVL